MSLIILDGPRGAGKTTTAKELVKRFQSLDVPAFYVKHLRHPEASANPVHEFNAMMEIITVASLDRAGVTIVDRLIWSEWVMGFATGRDTSAALTANSRCLSRVAHAYGAQQYILLPSMDELKLRIDNRIDPTGERQVDMPWQVVTPLWQIAASMDANQMVRRNQTIDDLDLLLGEIVHRTTGRVTRPSSPLIPITGVTVAELFL